MESIDTSCYYNTIKTKKKKRVIKRKKFSHDNDWPEANENLLIIETQVSNATGNDLMFDDLRSQVLKSLFIYCNTQTWICIVETQHLVPTIKKYRLKSGLLSIFGITNPNYHHFLYGNFSQIGVGAYTMYFSSISGR